MPDVEVHCISSSGVKETYDQIPDIILHPIDFSASTKKNIFRYILYALMFPIWNICDGYRLYKLCKYITTQTHFDLVVAQYHQEPSLLAGVWLRRKGLIKNLTVIFWDNLYGKTPRRFLPRWFSVPRLKRMENYVARHADALISLYPIKEYHYKHGDVSAAIGKRYYLGIPSIIPPATKINTIYRKVIDPNKINILYSGTIFRKSYVDYFVDVLNQTKYAEQINLIFFSRGVDNNVFEVVKQKFKGKIHTNDWIPLNELLSLYHDVDFFISFPGVPTAIRSKNYEYISYGKPIFILYDDDRDVNVSTFTKYPLSFAFDQRVPVATNAEAISIFIERTSNKIMEYDTIEALYPLDTASAYVQLLMEQIK